MPSAASGGPRGTRGPPATTGKPKKIRRDVFNAMCEKLETADVDLKIDSANKGVLTVTPKSPSR